MYDYIFDFEEDSKIPCLCDGATNCRPWMNFFIYVLFMGKKHYICVKFN